MLEKIYEELLLIKKELQAIRGSKESDLKTVLVRRPYSSTYEEVSSDRITYLQDIVIVRMPFSCKYDILPRSCVKIPDSNESF